MPKTRFVALSSRGSPSPLVFFQIFPRTYTIPPSLLLPPKGFVFAVYPACLLHGLLQTDNKDGPCGIPQRNAVPCGGGGV